METGFRRAAAGAAMAAAILGSGPGQAASADRGARPSPGSDAADVVAPDPTPPPPAVRAPAGVILTTAESWGPRGYAIPLGRAVPPEPPVLTKAAGPPPPDPGARDLVGAAPPLLAEPSVMRRAKACLRANAPQVAQAESSAKLAADFLLSDVCAREVEAAALYQHNRLVVAAFNPKTERGRAGLAAPRVDEDTGEIIVPPGFDADDDLPDGSDPGDLARAPADLRRFAAALIIAERLSDDAPSKKSLRSGP